MRAVHLRSCDAGVRETRAPSDQSQLLLLKHDVVFQKMPADNMCLLIDILNNLRAI